MQPLHNDKFLIKHCASSTLIIYRTVLVLIFIVRCIKSPLLCKFAVLLYMNMEKAGTIFLIILLAATLGCGGNKPSTDDLIIVDFTASYPKKELILQDFMDVEYIALETSDEFYTQGLVNAIGSDYILVRNRVNDGNIYIFDRKTGKGVRTINRLGRGPEEYERVSWGGARNILDEVNGEIFIKATAERMNVYDLHGNFKRSFRSLHDEIFDYDKDNLIGYDMSDFQKRGKEREKAYHVIISKLDGSITREIFIPFETIHTTIVIKSGGIASTSEFPHIIPHQGKWLLADTSSDTLYMYSPDHTLTPFLVRTPSIHVMNPEVYLSIMALTDSYYFIKTVKNDFDFETGRGFDLNALMYDKKENSVFEYAVYNDDYIEKRPLSKMMWGPFNHEIATSAILVPDLLVEDYRKGILKGRLKEIAAKFTEDNSRIESNPVIMLIKHKK